MVLAAAGLKAGQEDYWIRQIAESRCEYLSGHGETPGQWYGARAAALGLSGVAKDEQCHAMFAGKDPITGEQVAQPKWVADPRSKLPAGPLAERLRALAEERSIPVEALAGSQVLAAELRSVLGRREVKAETVERVARHILDVDPRDVYGDAYREAATHAGRRVDDRDACFDLCFSDVKSGSLFYAGADEATRREYVAARQEAIGGVLGWLEQHAVGVRRGHGGAEHLDGRGLLAIGYDHRTSREGDPQLHTHLLVQNLTEGPDGRVTALDSKRLWAHLMPAERVYQQLWRAELTRRLGLEFVQVADHEQLEIKGWEDKALRDAFSKRAAQVKAQCDAWGTSDTRTAREAARATRRAKDHSETEQVIYDRWRAELDEHGISEQAYAERLGRAAGQALTEEQMAALLGELAGPQGLTAQASTFARRDVVDHLARRLPTGTSATTTLAELEGLADRFLSERAVVVARDAQLAEVRYSTPELVALEERMLDGATARADAGCGVVAPEHLRATLEAFPTMAPDQADALADLTRSGAGVSLLVGKAGYGKTFVAGAAAHVYGLQGHRLIGTAPTGLAATGLASEGFGDARTVDRLLADLEQRRDRLDTKTVLLVDEAGMVGTRKLARLLEEAGRAEAKVILIGDDRQLSSIDAGGGFRGLRLRLGASELTQNRRQQSEWERQALELVRRFQVQEAVGLYREHDRVVVAETRDELTRGLLDDWRTAFRDGQDVVILAHRREDVGQFNLACQQVRTEAGELDPEARLQVADRNLAVGDRVVCGKNALKRLGVANGTRGTVVALDREARSLTIQVGDNAEAKGRGAAEGQTVTLPTSYLDGKGRPGAPRRVDLAYATTGHKSQGLTKWTSLPFVSGREDAQWLYVVLSRAKHLTRIYTVTGPEERPPELSEVPDTRRAPDGYERLAAAMGRDRAEQLASDARRLVNLRAMPTRELRAERDRLDDAFSKAPRDRRHEAERAAKRHAEREQRVRELKAAGRDGPELATAIRLADQAAEQARQLRQHQQQRAAWLETNADLVAERRAVMGELGWRGRADARALELDPPADLVAVFGPMPAERKAQAAWRAAVGQVDGYRRAWGIDAPGSAKHEGRSEREEEHKESAGRPAKDREAKPGAERETRPEEPDTRAAVKDRDREAKPTSDRTRPERRSARHERQASRAEELLGPQPTEDLGQRRAWQAARTTIERFRERTHSREDREREAG